MAPVDPKVANSNLKPTVELGSQAALIGLSVIWIVRHFWNQARSLPPAEDVRVRLARRNRDVAVFSLLSLASFATVSYFNIQRFIWSYKEWAHEVNERVPNALWHGWYASAEENKLYLGRWYQDTHVLQESFTIPLHKNTSWWWAQQSYSLLMVWSAFVGIESRLRNMQTPHVLAFVALANFTGISVAMNLFHVMLLLSPTPTGSSSATSKNAVWTPDWKLFSMFIIGSYGIIFYWPDQLSEPAFALQFKGALLISSGVLAGIISNLPASLGVSHQSVRDARRYWKPVFVIMALASAALHWNYLRGALLDTKQRLPPKRISLWKAYVKEQRSTTNQTLVTTEDIYSSLFDHPAISGPAWDVVLSVLSLCIWAAVRALDPADMLRSTFIPWGFRSDSNEEDSAVSSDTTSTESPKARRGRGKPKKNAATEAEASTNTTGTTRRKTRRRGKAHDSDSGEDDAFEPSQSTAAEVARTSHDGEHPIEAVQDAEASALTWILYMIGGLGAAGAGVYGADVRAR